jgi:hypothetical protein
MDYCQACGGWGGHRLGCPIKACAWCEVGVGQVLLAVDWTKVKLCNGCKTRFGASRMGENPCDH